MATQSTSIQIVIEAIDKAKDILLRAQQQVAGLNAANVQGAVSSATAAKALGALNTTGATAANVFQRVGEVFSQNKLLLLGFAGAVGASASALPLLARQAINNADSLNEFSQRLGVSTEFLSAMKLVAEQSGSNIGELAVGFRTLSRQMLEVNDPASKASSIFETLGFDLEQLRSGQLSSEQVFRGVAEGLSKMESGAQKAAIAQTLLGRSGQQLIPLFNGGAAAIDEATEKVKRFGSAVSTDFARQADEFNDKMRELQEILKGLGVTIAKEILPPLTKFVDFTLQHSEAVKVAFVGIAGSIAAIGVAITAVKFAGLTAGITSALIGLPKILSISEFIAALSLIPAKISEVTASLLKLTASKFTVVVTIAVAVVEAITTIKEFISSASAQVREAQTLGNLKPIQLKLVEIKKNQIEELVRDGKITEETANELYVRLNQAASVFSNKQIDIASRLRDTVFGLLTFDFGRALSALAGRTQQNTLASNELQSALDAVGKSAVSTAVAIDQTSAAVNKLTRAIVDIAKLKNIQLQIDLGKQLAAADQSLQEAITQRQFETGQISLPEKQRIQREQLTTSTSFQLEQSRQTQRISEITAIEEIRIKGAKEQDSSKKIAEDTEKALTEIKLKGESERRIILITEREKRFGLEKQGADEELKQVEDESQQAIEVAKIRGDQLAVIELERQKRVRDIIARDLTLREEEQIGFDQAEALAREEADQKISAIDRRTAEARITQINAELDAQQKLIESDPTPNRTANQRQLNDLIEKRNQATQEEIELERQLQEEILQEQLLFEDMAFREEELRASQSREFSLNVDIVERRRRENLQPPEAKNLPRFNQSLGFQNKLDAQGNIQFDGAGNAIRELQNEFAALDTFLSTSLQNTFDGLTNSITGLITGTRTWAQVWTQVGNAIIGNIVQLILEYTIFNQIRTVLDHIFFAKQRTEIGVTKGVASAARAADTAESVSQAATTASAWSPAAIFASIGSFGAAGVIGLAVVLAALGAVAAGAFSKGGRVPGTPSTEDDKIAAVSSGEVIISTPSVAKLESKVGPEGIEKLLAGEVPVVKQSATTKQVEKEKTTERETKIDSQTVRDVTAADMQRAIIERIKKTTAAFARSGARFADGGIVDEEDYKAGTLAAIPAVVRQFESVDRSSEFVRERLGAVQPPAPKGQDEKIPIAELASKMFHVEHLRTGESSKMFLSSASDEATKRNIVENKLELERITQTKRSEMGSSGSVDQLPPSRVVELAESVKAIELHTVTEAVKTLSEVTRHSQSDFKSVSDSVGNESLRAIELHAASEAAKTVIREVAIQSEIERQDTHFNVQDSAKVESERQERVLTSDSQIASKTSDSSSAFISNALEREREEITSLSGQRLKDGGIVRPEDEEERLKAGQRLADGGIVKRVSVSKSESIRKSKIEEEERLARLRNTSQRLADGGIVRRNRELEKVGSAAAFQTITESSQSRANLPAEVILLSRADIDGQGAVPPAAAVVSALVSNSSVARDRIEREKAGLESKLISESIAVENTRTESTSEFAKHVSDVDKLNEIDRVRSASADAVRSISETVFNLSDKSHTDTSSRITRTASTSDLRAEHLSSEALRDIERVRSASTETAVRTLSETVSKLSASSVESQSEKISDVSKLSSVAVDRVLSETLSKSDSELSLARVERIRNENTATATRALSETVSRLASTADEVNVLKTEDDTATFSTSLLNRINEQHSTASTSSTVAKELMRLLVETNRVTAHTRTLDASDIDRERDRERVTRIITSLMSSLISERFASGGILRGPGGPREDKIPIWASAGEGILTASSVAYYGPQLVHALNRKELPKELLRQAAMTNVVIAAAFKANKAESKFAFGGIVARDSGAMSMADGGVIERSLVTSVKTSDQTLRTVERVNTPSFNPNINVAPAAVTVAVIDNEARYRKFMEEHGNAMAFDYTKRRKVELGVRSS